MTDQSQPRSRKTPWGRLAALVVIAIATTAWAGAQSLSDTLVWAHSSPPRTLDPHITDTASVIRPARAAYEGLLGYAPGSTELIPLLAESWEVLDGGAAYVFHLRQGVLFHDGTPFTAEAVKVSLERYDAIGTAVLIQPFESAEVIDDYTVKVSLDKPNSAFLYMVPKLWIVSPAGVAEHATSDDPWARQWFLDHADGTGPYQFSEWVIDQNVSFERFPDYWGGFDERAPQKVVHRIIREPATQRLMLERGEIDIAMNLSIDDVPGLSRNPDIAVETHETPVGLYFRLALTKPPLNDIRVRQALQLAFDQQSLMVLREGLSGPLTGPVPASIPGSVAYDRPYDPERARQLLADAGVLNSGLVLTYRYSSGFEEQRRAGELLQQTLAGFGITLNLVEGTYGSMVESWGNESTTPELSGFFQYPSYPDVDSFLFSMYYSSVTPAAGNPGRYSNPEVDKLITLAQATTDPALRDAIYAQAQDEIVEDAVDVYVSNPGYLIAMRKWVEGYTYDPAFHDTINFRQIRLNKP